MKNNTRKPNIYDALSDLMLTKKKNEVNLFSKGAN